MAADDSRFCVDEEAVLAAHRARLMAMSAYALHARAQKASLAVILSDGRVAPPPPAFFANPAARAYVIDSMLSPEGAGLQYQMGNVMQYAHNPQLDALAEHDEEVAAKLAKMPPRTALGDISEAEEEALGWFLTAARHGHAGAMDAVALYFNAERGPGGMAIERLASWPHDAAFYLWKATQHDAQSDSAETLDRFFFRLQDIYVPLALKDAQGAADANTVKRLVRLLQTGPRLAQAAAPPYNDAAAQFLFATQLLGTPAPRHRVEHIKGDPRPDNDWPHVTEATIELHDVRGAGTEPRRRAKAQALLRASAAAGFEPAISFLAAAGADLHDVAAALGPRPEALQRLYDRANRDGIPNMMRRTGYGTRATVSQVKHELELLAARNNEEGRRASEVRPPGERCERCGRTDVKMKLCGQCCAARYCSEACQRAAWKLHKPACMPAAAAKEP